MDSHKAFLRNVETAAFWECTAPWLHIGATCLADDTFGEATEPRCQGAPHWPTAGFLRIDNIVAQPTVQALARAIQTLRLHDMHPTFLYVYDETWSVADALRPSLAHLLGDDFEMLADVWAWYVDPLNDSGGWPIHRGWYEDVRESTGQPALVNLWIALTDATERNACMHIVPLTHDPHYPHDLGNLSALDGLGVALPTPAGSALVWNANAAHWGGRCDPSFDKPRISMSFTARRPSGPAQNLATLRPPLDFRARLDLIADQFLTYGSRELTPESHEMRWAALVHGMRTAASRSRGSACTQ
jgi:hypothetical protein